MKAQDSKCWTCKHGLCVKETENQTIVHEGIPHDKAEDYESDIFGTSDYDDPIENIEPLTSDLTHVHIKAICFWKPETVEEAPPIVVSMVEACNRYEEQSS